MTAAKLQPATLSLKLLRTQPPAGLRVVEFTHLVEGVRARCEGFLSKQTPCRLEI
jgi:primosomal replication protein N